MLGVVRFVRVRSVHSHAHLGSSGSFRWARFIPSRTRGHRVPSVVFGPIPCALGVIVLVRGVRSITVPPGDPRGSSVAFGPFPYAFEIVLDGSIHSRVPWGSFGSL